MFNYNHVQAIFISLFIKLVEKNLTKVNELLVKHAYDGAVVFKCLGLVVRLSRPAEVRAWALVIEALGNKHGFKLSKDPIINKRTLNELKVWFHKYGYNYRTDAISYISRQIDTVDVHPHVKNVSVLDRLLGTQKEHGISFGNNLLNEIMPSSVVVQRSIFNKLSIFTTVTTNGFGGCLSAILPVHLGVTQAYDTKSQDTVNGSVREALHEHLKNNLQ